MLSGVHTVLIRFCIDSTAYSIAQIYAETKHAMSIRVVSGRVVTWNSTSPNLLECMNRGTNERKKKATPA